MDIDEELRRVLSGPLAGERMRLVPAKVTFAAVDPVQVIDRAQGHGCCA